MQSLYIHITTLQVFGYFTRILLDKISLVIFSELWKRISRNTSQQLLQRLQLLLFSSSFNSLNKPGITFVNF